MYIIKVLGKEHIQEHIEDLLIELVEKAEFFYAERFFCDTTEEYKEASKQMKAYEIAILECFRLATVNKAP